MPKIQFSDVTPPERRSIRDVPIPNSGKRKVPINIKPDPRPTPKPEPAVSTKISEIAPKRNSNVYEYYYPKDEKEVEQYFPGRDRSKKFIFGGTAVFFIAVFVVVMMTIFASATINITPKSQWIEVNTKITGTNEAVENANAVRYEVIKLSKTSTVDLPATGEEAAEVKALGKIVVYNNFSTEPQRLIIRTRFESPEGLIYRIPESIIVPGKSVKNGVEIPGSLEVEVFADEAGEKYNIKKADFTVPGFKNDANRYKNFYARSVTDMTGGFIGKRKTVLPVDKQTALQNIESETETALEKELQSKVPEGLVLLSGAIRYESRELPPKESSSSVVVGKEITAFATMMNKQDLSNKIVSEYVSKLSECNNIGA